MSGIAKSLISVTRNRPERVNGFDTIRFVLAGIVAIGHTGVFPLLEGMDRNSRVGLIIRGFYGASINGPAAVIVFFVISGFCIHYQYRNGEPLCIFRYYPRRYLRILIPLAGAICFARCLGITLQQSDDSILWSIVCEEIYYLIYPLLLHFGRRHGWVLLVAISFIMATVVARTNPSAGGYPMFGWQLNWVLGLPCWLLGVMLARKSDSLRLPVTRRKIWSWRLIVWFASGVLLGLRFHAGIGYAQTLNYFAILCYFWLQREIRYFRNVRPPKALEWAGKWSYSLYLLHVPAEALYNRLGLPNLGFILNWILRFAWILACSYVFYLVLEKPSHAFSRWVGRGAGKLDRHTVAGASSDESTTVFAENPEPTTKL
jgi:peptidoglycan/LPS O-acetylase OafA/YrhL